MENKKKSLTVKEIFCGMPFLQRYFVELDRKIRLFTPEGGKCEEVEKLKRKRKDLLYTAKNIDAQDLQILYYLHSLKRIFSSQVLTALKKLYETQEEFIQLVNEGELP